MPTASAGAWSAGCDRSSLGFAFVSNEGWPAPPPDRAGQCVYADKGAAQIEGSSKWHVTASPTSRAPGPGQERVPTQITI